MIVIIGDSCRLDLAARSTKPFSTRGSANMETAEQISVLRCIILRILVSFEPSPGHHTDRSADKMPT